MANDTEIYRLPSAPNRRQANRPSRLAGSTAVGSFADDPSPQLASQFALWEGDYPKGGVRQVLKRMAQLAQDGATNPAIRALALDATAQVAPDARTGQPDRTDRRAVAAAVYRLIVQRVEYVHDAHGVEALQTPAATLFTGAGDCDDMAVLAAALLGALGVPARFRAIATDPSVPDAYTHVYAEFKAGGRGRWRSLDPVGNPGVEAPIAPGRVYGETTYPVRSAGGPEELTVLSLAPGANEGRRIAAGLAELAELRGLDGLGAGPTGPISGPDAWVQIIGRSHEGRVPANERFYIDLRVEREYTEFRSCAIPIIARHAESGDVLANATVQGSKWFSLSVCGGDVRLTFPLDFAPASTPVNLEVYDPDLFTSDDLIGESGALYLSEEPVSDYTGPWEEIAGAAGETREIVEAALKVGLVAAVGFAAASAWPYVRTLMASRKSTNG